MWNICNIFKIEGGGIGKNGFEEIVCEIYTNIYCTTKTEAEQMDRVLSLDSSPLQ